MVGRPRPAKIDGEEENTMYCKMIKEFYELKEGTKNAYQFIKSEVKEYDREQYRNYIEAAPFFRRLGGSEYLERAYTCAGYLVNRVISKSPDRKSKRIAKFYFWNNHKNEYSGH